MDTVEPQLIIKFDKNNKAKDIYFLTPYTKRDMVSLTDYYTYNVYEYLKTLDYGINNIKPIILQDHILLTLDISNTKAYIKSILNINENILLYSLWNNIDFEYIDKEIFNPFNIKENYKEVPQTTILYDIYTNIAKGAIFFILEESESKDSYLFHNNVRLNDKINYYLLKIMKNLNLYNYNIKTEDKININYNNNFHHNHYVNFLNLSDEYYKIYTDIDSNVIKFAGNKLTIIPEYKEDEKSLYLAKLEENHDKKVKNDSNKQSAVIKKDIFTSANDEIFLYDEEEFNNIITKNTDFKDVKIIQQKNKYTTTTTFDVVIHKKIHLDYDLIFFLTEIKKTKNIYLDPSKNINIITSKDHFSIRSTKEYLELPKYLTVIFLAYINIYENFSTTKPKIKIDNRYFSRYCQNSKTIKKKPILINNDLTNLNGAADTDKRWFRTEGGDIYVDKDNNLTYKCTDSKYKNIGFVNEIFQGMQICLPCCYLKSKEDTSTFKKCVYNEDIDLETLNPYLIKYKTYKILLDKNKFGEIDTKLYKLLNKNTSNTVNSLYKLENVKDYPIYRTFEDTDGKGILLTDLDSICDFIKRNDCIIIKEGMFLFSDKTIKKLKNYIDCNEPTVKDDRNEPMVNRNEPTVNQNEPTVNQSEANEHKEFKLLIIVKDKLHSINNLTKTKNDYKIKMEDLNIPQWKEIYNKIKNINRFNYKIEDENLIYKNNLLYLKTVDNKNELIKFQLKSKYFIIYNNISLAPNTIANYIIFNYCSKYFNNIYTEDMEVFQRIWIINLLNILEIKNSLLTKENIDNLKIRLDNYIHEVRKTY